ncbi:TPA: hypothetical protein KRN68_003671 [Clostridioides difficile]|nr:hypothetical protein [Clostridioides difficile]
MKNTIKKEMIIRSKMMFFIFQVKKSGTLLIINPAINKNSLAKCMYFKKERSGKGVLFISEKITIQINAVPITTLPIL